MNIFTILIIGLLALVQAKDYYKILDVAKDADERTIKQAYRRLSKTYHPDKNPSDEAHEKFIEVGEAYEVLSDPEKRLNYDQYGDPNHGGPNVDFGDMFNSFFGGMGGMGGMRGQKRVRKGENKFAAMSIPLRDFYTGKDLEFNIQMKNLCRTCDGTGSQDKETHKCGKCNGQGVTQMRRQLGPGMFQTFQVACEDCNGKGKIVTNKCKACHGEGVEDTDRGYKLYIPPGLTRDHQHVMPGEGDQNPDWVAGDIIVKIQEDLNDSWGYRRIGNNLFRTEILTLEESLLGDWSRSIPFFDSIEHEIDIHREPGQQTLNNEVEVLKGKGMPILGDDEEKHGDLFIEYKVLIPETVNLMMNLHNNNEKDEL